ncbi:metallopeptidase TldD-related protein [Edaphobacter sp.]|uniref:metallopeptidase TldD-related protein n=1 Tax=Edaphobacter sp. TaxID=1934404 RepID=UPI002DBE32B7|nr:metallopeptidase TldD-related protein [Edaphobacter sp.]HEU5340596.1 metallopeptidase TldD-related protein [Edaphobacter sp.]
MTCLIRLLKSLASLARPRSLSASALMATLAVVPVAFAQKPPNTDPLMKAMQAELQREKAALVLPGMQAPYFIEYRMDDFTTYEAVANYGALAREEAGHQRILHVTVRVGDYAHDSSGRGDGSLALGPADNDPTALRYALWIATDTAYKNALRAYAAKEAALKQYQSTRPEHDFAEEKPVVHIAPLVALDLDRNDWKRRIITASGLYATEPSVRSFATDVQYSTSSIRAVAVNRYLVNTEGTVLRQGYTGYSGAISVGGQAPDGMRVSRDNETVGVDAKDLESWPAFRTRVIDDLKSLEELRKAPLVSADDYHGPVLFSGDAATGLFSHLFMPNVLATRPAMGTSARTNGEYAASYKSRVLPDFLSVTDDPLEAKFAGRSLLGAYTIDDQGVPAQSVNVVVNGVLENFLTGREPIRDFPISNGHGRAALAQAAHASSSVMIVKSSQPLTKDALNKRLLSMAKDQGHDVYYVETLGGPFVPRLLYLVHQDGTRQLVRGAAFDELDTRSLRSDIVAAGSDPYVDQTLGPIPTTTIAPSLLFDDVGIKRATVEQEKLPYYPPPAIQ